MRGRYRSVENYDARIEPRAWIATSSRRDAIIDLPELRSPVCVPWASFWGRPRGRIYGPRAGSSCESVGWQTNQGSQWRWEIVRMKH